MSTTTETTIATAEERAKACDAYTVRRAEELRAQGNTIATAADTAAVEACARFYGGSSDVVRQCAIQGASNAARVALGGSPL